MLLPSFSGTPFNNGTTAWQFEYVVGDYAGPGPVAVHTQENLIAGTLTDNPGGRNTQGLRIVDTNSYDFGITYFMKKERTSSAELLGGALLSHVDGAHSVVVAGGWVNRSIFCAYIKAPVPVLLRYAEDMHFGGLVPGSVTNLAQVNVSATARQVTLGGQNFEFFTHNVSYLSKDNVSTPSSNPGQLTFTYVPADESQALAGSPSLIQSYRSGFADEVAFHVPNFLEGTVYIHMGRGTVATVQDWIAQDLVRATNYSDSVRLSELLAELDVGIGVIAPAAVVVGPFDGEQDEDDLMQITSLASSYSMGGPDFAGIVQGVVSVLGVPASRLVRIYDQTDGEPVASMWSGQDGSYAFDGLRVGREYFVISHDYQRTFTAVAKDRIQL